MKITIESTDQFTHLDGVMVRVWRGVTEAGVACTVFVHRLAVHKSQDSSQFEAELLEKLEPGRVVPLSMIL